MKRYSATIKAVREETHDVKTFRLIPEKRISFIPGQYTLVLLSASGEEQRPFTFASSPTERYLELTIKNRGPFTGKIHDLNPEEIIYFTAPSGGSLNFDDSIKDDVVFIAAGSGITPFMSAMRYAIAKGLHNDLVLIYSNKTKMDIIFQDELLHMGNKENIKVINTLTRSAPKDWDGEKGRIDEQMIRKHVPDTKRLWYVCGPPPMVSATRNILASIGAAEDKIRYEDWQIPGKG